MTLLKALPLAAALFVLFPRLTGPLWGMPGESRQANTGLSNSMSPGSISRLLESDDVVFRVRFDGRMPSRTGFTGAGRCSEPLPAAPGRRSCGARPSRHSEHRNRTALADEL
jgi:hypothetical protein